MESVESSVYFACQTKDSVIIQIQGKANYQNARVLDEFLKDTLQLKFKKYCIFFGKCTQLDSTCLGILAGLLLKLKTLGGVCLFCELQERQLASIKMLGLDTLAHVVEPSEAEIVPQATGLKSIDKAGAPLSSEFILQAHQFLMEIESRNKIHFQNVISLLEKDVPH